MPRPSVIPGIREKLEQYLNDCEAAFQQQPVGMRTPTIPATGDGKVNVRQVGKAIGLSLTQEKYLYERGELSSLINLMAEGQGLAPIGARVSQDAADKAAKEKALRQAQNLRAASQAAIEAQAQHEELIERIKDLSRAYEELSAENLRLKARLDAIESGMFVPEVE